MATNIKLNQTLHGYADGHQLLASSTDLTSDQRALLLVMSDLSGPAFRSGFDSYLTGYPLKNSDQYCFARTWFAPELTRPGCVWTHTLLIKNEDLPKISNLEILGQLFRKPTTLDDKDQYEDPLLIQDASLKMGDGVIEDGQAILAALYGTTQQIVIPSSNSHKYERTILAIFDQQWPQLRKSFRFCTGTLSWRDSEFDLSVCPPEQVHSIGKSALVIGKGRQSKHSSEEWVNTAADDLAYGAPSDYRRFLWRFGPDYANGRVALRPLTEIFQILNAPDNHETIGKKVLSAITSAFPKVTDGHQLKMEVFGRNGGYLAKLGGEAGVIKTILAEPTETLDTTIIDIQERAIGLVEKDIDTATTLALFAAQHNNANSQVYLKGYFDRALESEDILQQMSTPLMLDILERQPALLGKPALWERLDKMGLINKVLMRFSVNPTLLADVVNSMMTAQAWDIIERLAGQFGTPILKQIFKIIDEANHTKIDFPDALYSIIGAHPAAVADIIEQDEIGAISLKMLTAEADPRWWYWRRIKLTSWQNVLKTPISFSNQTRSLRSAVFLLNVGLSERDKEAAALVPAFFGSVYEAASIDALDDSRWDQLKPVLSWYSPSWDKCGRLIRTATKAFKDNDWPARYFPQIFNTEEQFAHALLEINETWRGKDYIARLKDAGHEGEFSWSKQQIAAMNKFAK